MPGWTAGAPGIDRLNPQPEVDTATEEGKDTTGSVRSLQWAGWDLWVYYSGVCLCRGLIFPRG